MPGKSIRRISAAPICLSLIHIWAEAGNVDEAFLECDYVFEDRYTTQAIHHAAIEPHIAIADFNPAGKLTIYSPCQNTCLLYTSKSWWRPSVFRRTLPALTRESMLSIRCAR